MDAVQGRTRANRSTFATIALATMIAMSLNLESSSANDDLADDFRDFSKGAGSEDKSDEGAATGMRTTKSLKFRAPKKAFTLNLNFDTDATFNSNALATATAEQSNYSTAPGISLEAIYHDTASSMTYKLVIGALLNRGTEVSPQFDNDKLDVLAKVTFDGAAKSLLGFSPSIAYKRRHSFEPFYDAEYQTYDELGLTLDRVWKEQESNRAWLLSLSASDRWVDPSSGDRTAIGGSLKMTQRYADDTIRLIAVGAGNYTLFNSGVNDGREDFTLSGRVRLEADAGIEHMTLGLTLSASHNISNRASADGINQLSFGPTLGITYTFP